MAEEKLKNVQEQLKHLQNHILLHWIENEQVPTAEEIIILERSIKEIIDKISDIRKELKVFGP